MRHLVRHHALQLVPAQRREQSLGHRDAGGAGVAPGGEGVGVVIGHHPDPRLRASPRRSPSPRPRSPAAAAPGWRARRSPRRRWPRAPAPARAARRTSRCRRRRAVVKRPMKGMTWWYAAGCGVGGEEARRPDRRRNPTQAKKTMNPTTSQFERRRLASCCAKRLASSLTAPVCSATDRPWAPPARRRPRSPTARPGVALARPATSMVGKVACLVLYWVATSL